jgi:hypothetical protein
MESLVEVEDVTEPFDLVVRIEDDLFSVFPRVEVVRGLGLRGLHILQDTSHVPFVMTQTLQLQLSQFLAEVLRHIKFDETGQP